MRVIVDSALPSCFAKSLLLILFSTKYVFSFICYPVPLSGRCFYRNFEIHFSADERRLNVLLLVNVIAKNVPSASWNMPKVRLSICL